MKIHDPKLTGSIEFQSNVVGNIPGTASWATNVVNGTSLSGGEDKFIARWNGTNSITTSSIYQGDDQNIAINATSFDAIDPQALLVSGSTINIISGEANVDSYAQLNIVNKREGGNASADIVATNDSGTETGNFVDLGINSSNYGGAIGSNNEAYLYNTGSNFLIGNTTRGADANLKLFAGNDAAIFPVIVTGSQAILTGSLFGTSSYVTGSVFSHTNPALSSSYSLSSSLSVTASFVSGAVFTSTNRALSASYALSSSVSTTSSFSLTSSNSFTSSYVNNLNQNLVVTGSVIFSGSSTAELFVLGDQQITGSLTVTNRIVAQSVTASFTGSFTGNLIGTASYVPPSYIDNLVTVGLPGSNTTYTSIKTAVDSITDAAVNNTYTVRVYPGVYIEDTINVPSYVAVKGDSSTSTIVSASNENNRIFQLSDQSMLIDMQIQGSTGTGVSAIYYSSSTTPQRNAIAYAENIRFGSNYTNATCEGLNGANIILQCSNVKYGGYTDTVSQKSFDVGFVVTGSNSGIGRMQLRNVTSTNGGVAGSSQDQIFALAAAPSCTFIVNGCLLTRAVGSATGTGFKVYNGGSLRLTAVNFQRWTRGIWAPQTGSAPSIDAIALNFENCTTDVAIEHSGSTGKVQGTDNFLKTQISLSASLYEVGQDPRRITVAKKGGDFTSISASVAYITDSAESNRYVIEIGPGEFVEKQIDMSSKPYIALLGSDIQTTVIVPSGSGAYDHLLLGPTNEISFLSFKGNNVAGYSAITTQNLGADFSQAHKVSIYDYDYGIKVLANTADTTFYGEYVDINGSYSYGTYVSSSNGYSALASVENYYLFPSNSAAIGNYATGPSSSFGLYTCLFQGDGTAGSTAIKIERGAVLEATSLDVQNWDYGVQVPNTSPAPDFRIVGSMFHDSVTYDFEVLNASATGRFQGVASHTKISNASEDFYWNFLDDLDGENDITRNLAVTFADGTHTDASTLIFNGSPMGPFTGGELTTGSGFVLNVNSGSGYLESSANGDIYKRLDWSAGTVTLPASSNSYIYVTETNTLTYNGTQPSSLTNLILGRVVTNTASIEFIDQSPFDAAHMSNKLSAFNRAALGPVYSEGSTVTENVTPYAIDVTSGKYFFSENQFIPTGGTGITMRQYFISASTFNISSTTLVPKDKYASGSALVAMSSSYYTKHTLYLVGDGVDEKYMLVINNNQYASLVEAENANLPTIPTYFSDGVVALAAIYTNSGSANITQIQDIRPTIAFRAAGVNASAVHGNLLGLDADDHTQYLLVDGTRAMNGNLSLGGNNITNVGSVNATSFTGSLLGTASLAENANTASYVLNAVTASFVTGSIFHGSNIAKSSSYAITSSYAQNGGVTQIIAGTNISISPTDGLGAVTINSTGGAGASDFPYTGSAIISGSLLITGSFRTLASGTEGGAIKGDVNNYLEFFVQNTNTGLSASTDLVAYNDTGNKNQNYVDMGINGSGISPTYSFGKANDAYVYNTGGDFFIGNSTAFYQPAITSQSLHLFSNAPGTPDVTITGSRMGIQKSSSLNATLDVNGNTIVSGTLFVSGTHFIDLDVKGNAAMSGTLFITASLNNQALHTIGDILLSGSVIASASFGPDVFNAVGNANFTGSFMITGSGVSSQKELVVRGEAAITGSLEVTNGLTAQTVTASNGIRTNGGNSVITGSLIVSGSGGYGVFSKGITLADLTNGFDTTGSYYVWRAPYPATVVAIWAIKSGSATLDVNARRSGSGTALHLATNLVISANNLWTSGGTVQNTSYSAGDSLELIISGSGQYQASVQVDFIKR